MVVFLVSSLVATQRIHQTVQVVRPRFTLVAHATTGVRGSVAVRIIKRGSSTRHIIALPSSYFPSEQADRHRPTLVARALGRRAAVAVVLHLRTGVYGYKKVIFLLADEKDVRVLGPEDVEFSDFGSWVWSNDGRSLRVWDMDLVAGVEAHEQEHHYVVNRLRLRGDVFRRTESFRTKKKYNPGWGEDGDRPVQVRQDPLVELGLRWKWWGNNPG
jgi:hypothetical protein